MANGDVAAVIINWRNAIASDITFDLSEIGIE